MNKVQIKDFLDRAKKYLAWLVLAASLVTAGALALIDGADQVQTGVDQVIEETTE